MSKEAQRKEPESDLWVRLSAMPRPGRLVDFPRKGEDGEPVGQTFMRILTQEECLQAQVAAEQYVRGLFGKAADDKDGPRFAGSVPKRDEASIFDTLHQNAVSVELLFRSCRRPEGDGQHEGPKWPSFPSPAELRKKLSNDEIGVLMREYLQVQADLGPITSTMEEGEFDAWVERIAKSGSTSPFASLSWEAASELILLMASRLWSSRTATSSSGSPRDDGASETGSDEVERLVEEHEAEEAEDLAANARAEAEPEETP